jgi:hypothetical protein
MNTRLPTVVAALSIAGFLVWLGYRAGGAQPGVEASSTAAPAAMVLQERSGGSEVPCDVPLAWRVARVDPEFGVRMEEATRAVEEAARLWESGTGRQLFSHDPENGFPVRLVYGERQERLMERGRRTGELDANLADLEARRSEVETRAAALQAAVGDYATRVADLDRRVGEHNAAVRESNQSNDPDDARLRDLAALGAALEREREALVRARPALDQEQEAVRAAEDDLNRSIAEYERLARGLEAALPPEEVEAGVYREAVSRQGGEVVAVSREIRLYRFASGDELRLLAAHELGHALGLGHTDEAGGVMSASARSDQPVTSPTEADLTLFASVCPDR